MTVVRRASARFEAEGRVPAPIPCLVDSQGRAIFPSKQEIDNNLKTP
jgi:hypothetical protein